MDISYTNHATGMLFYFVDIQYSNFSIYNSIGGSIKFKDIRTIQILIQKSDNKFIILKLSSVKYYLFISIFNLILVS
jgi:hypothetical protein